MKQTSSHVLLAWLILGIGIASRVIGVWYPSLENFSPFMALTMCTVLFAPHRSFWLVPFGALLISDALCSRYYHYIWSPFDVEYATRMAAFVFGAGVGWWIRQNLTITRVVTGSLLASLVFYVVSNTGSWWTDRFYEKSLMGWITALTTGHPEFPPTWTFFRNTIISDQLFTALFVWVALGVKAGTPTPDKAKQASIQ